MVLKTMSNDETIVTFVNTVFMHNMKPLLSMSFFIFFILCFISIGVLGEESVNEKDRRRSILNFFSEKADEVRKLADQVLILHRGRCESRLACTCAYASCTSDITSNNIEEDFCIADSLWGSKRVCQDYEGRTLNFRFSSVRLPTSTSPYSASSKFKEEACWYRNLDSEFLKNYDNDLTSTPPNTLSWQYMGLESGYYQIFPANPQLQCGSYDPRLRPWYAIAASGPKDVVLVIDISGSMAQHNRFENAKQAVLSVLTTLSIHDHVAVVVFESHARTLLSHTKLQRATYAMIDRIKEAVNTVEPRGGTNFKAGLMEAFDIIDRSHEHSVDEFTSSSNCHTSILFLTDGKDETALGSTLSSYVRDRNRNISATLFTYSMGANADDTITKQLACEHNGIWTKVYEFQGNDLRTTMSQFYYFYAIQGSKDPLVVWSEPYYDASGAGNVTTASMAVFDNTYEPPLFIGVVGIDVLMSTLRNMESNSEVILDIIVDTHAANCPIEHADECVLENLRNSGTLSEDEKVLLSTLGGDPPVSRVCNATLFRNCPDPTVAEFCPISFSWDFCPSSHDSPSMCCGKKSSMLSIYVGVIVAVVAVLLLTSIACCCKKSQCCAKQVVVVPMAEIPSNKPSAPVMPIAAVPEAPVVVVPAAPVAPAATPVSTSSVQQANPINFTVNFQSHNVGADSKTEKEI